MNQRHRNHEILRIKATIGIKRAERSFDERCYPAEAMLNPERYETLGLQRRLNRLLKEHHAKL